MPNLTAAKVCEHRNHRRDHVIVYPYVIAAGGKAAVPTRFLSEWGKKELRDNRNMRWITAAGVRQLVEFLVLVWRDRAAADIIV